MPRVVITVVSLLAVLVHVGLGCCLHHAHAADEQPQATACSAGHHHHGDELAHHDHGGLPTQLPPHDDCHEAHCFATLAAAASLPDEPGLSVPAIDLAICTSGGDLATAAALALAGDAPADHFRPPSLRAHLRFCVLLN